MTTRLPNILVFFTDQQRWDTLGCYGQPLKITPNLDLMADEGVRFENAFTPQPVCGPARACIQTGKYATEVGCFRNDIALPKSEKTIAHWLSEAGYEVGYIGKWHLASTGKKFNYRTSAVPLERRGGYKDFWLASDVLEFTSHGYDGHTFDANMQRVEFKGYRVDCLTNFALDYLRTRKQDRPFFLFLSYIEPHHQNDHNQFEGPRGSKEKFKSFTPPGDLLGTQGDWREQFPDYLGCINSLDANLSRIRGELEMLGMAENTLIIYASDHGSHFRTRNSEYKRSCHDGCIRIPLIINGPGFRSGKVIRELVSLIDLPPTILDAANLSTPTSMRGRSLSRLVQGGAEDWRDDIFLQISESQVGRALRTHKWKYAIYAPDGDGCKQAASRFYHEQFLYDLENDPHERTNLVAAPDLRQVRAELAERLKCRMMEAGEAEPVIQPTPV
ncbi:sulfatase-like hydrolase/transferase [candidate division KSB1 bacterium]|nr:sulfatase-like hydrolase/transferase [candidate division KSB1 bacterium]